MSSLYNNKGMTLVEVLVSGIIGAIIAGVILSIIGVQGSIMNEGTAHARGLAQINAVQDTLGRAVRHAALLLAQNECTGWQTPPATPNSVAAFYTHNTQGDITGGFRVHNSYLQRGALAGASNCASVNMNWTDLTLAGTPIKLATASPAQPFTLAAGRKSVSVSCILENTYRNKTYLTAYNGGSFSCRN